MNGSNGRTFETWLAQVDAFIENILSLGIDDLPDLPFDRWYREGLAPGRAALVALKEVGYHGN